MFKELKENLNGKLIALSLPLTLAMSGSVFAAGETTTGLSSVITADSISGIMSEITNLIPVILPTVIGFMAFRKGWSWFKSVIKGA